MVRFARREERFHRTLGKQWTAELEKVYHVRQPAHANIFCPLLMDCAAAPPHHGLAKQATGRFF
jgi:hypothetical protein